MEWFSATEGSLHETKKIETLRSQQFLVSDLPDQEIKEPDDIAMRQSLVTRF
jgi:hypothetical protein